MHQAILRDLLEPLGLYRTDAVFAPAEVSAAASALDALFARISALEREALPDTCADWGLIGWETLLLGGAQTGQLDDRRRALRALLGISGDGLTLQSLNEALYGSGTWAQVGEIEPGAVMVSFPGRPGIPDAFERRRAVIEEILPCHLEIRYRYWYTNWNLFEQRFVTMEALDLSGMGWRMIEMMVEEEAVH